MSRWAVAIPGPPRPWSVGTFGKGQVRKSATLREYQTRVFASVHAVIGRELADHDGPVRLDAVLIMPRPQRLMRRSDPDGLVWCTKRPDRDNIVKAIQDALQRPPKGFSPILADDSLITIGETVKAYAEKSAGPRTVLYLDTEVGTPEDELTRMGMLETVRATAKRKE